MFVFQSYFACFSVDDVVVLHVVLDQLYLIDVFASFLFQIDILDKSAACFLDDQLLSLIHIC